jgi:hypothetical protein
MADTSPSIAPDQDPLLEIIAHLGAALSQSIPSDDPIIIEHVRDAHQLALELRRGAAMSKELSNAPV